MSMSSPILITQTLVSLVERATCIQDLTPLLNSMFRLTEMKDIVKQRLSAMNISQKRDLHLKVSPMDELLPHHIIQYMVGFNEDHRNVALVNKTFHKCSQSAQRLLLRQQQTDWQREFNDLHSDFGNNRITHVYSSPHHNTLRPAIEHAHAGDTLIIHQGVYEFEGEYEVEKNIKLIGYGSNVVIKQETVDGLIMFMAEYTYLQNIRFECDNDSWLAILRKGCSFYMENCVISFNFIALEIDRAKTVKIKNCVIKGADRSRIGFYCDYQSPAEVLEIESCVFENCCRKTVTTTEDHCIVFHQEQHLYQENQTKFRCIGNEFKNNFGLPIVAPNPDKINMEYTQILNNTWSYNHDIVIPFFRTSINPNKTYPFTVIEKQPE
eukprot:886099_1